MSEDEYEAFFNLKINKNILLQKTYKGISFAVIDGIKCARKMGELLIDCSKFIKIELKSKHTVNQDIRH